MTYRQPCDPDDLNPSNHKGCLADAAERESKRAQVTIRLSVIAVCLCFALIAMFAADCNIRRSVVELEAVTERARRCEHREATRD